MSPSGPDAIRTFDGALSMNPTSDAIWVVTPYFNPAGYNRRLDNFRAFRRHLRAPLLVVELAREGRHQLKEDDADIVIKLTGEDRMWQKERMINIGVAELPRHVEFVAWADCDIIFENENWADEAARRLARNGGLLQPFETVAYMPNSIDPASVTPRQCEETRPLGTATSSAAAARTSLFDENEARSMASQGAYEISGNCYGMAWAARRSEFERCGLFDGAVIGGGDSVKTFAALRKFDHFIKTRPCSPGLVTYAENWIRRAEAAGLLQYLDNLPHHVFHLWHGEVADRNYRGRRRVLVDHDFDPTVDIELAENGTWRWTHPQGELAREVGDYFFARKEDGACE